MWAKLDDQFYLNKKNATIDRDEQDLFFAGIIYCSGQLTDGFIPSEKLMQLYIWAKLPLEANIVANAQAIAQRLVDHCYWEIVAGGYNVHDYLDWNMSKEEVLALKAARTEAGRRGGNKSQAKRQASAQAKLKQNSTLSLSLNPSPDLNKDIEASPISTAFSKAFGITAYDHDKWLKACQEMTKQGVTIEEIPITRQVMDDGEMQYSGPWSIQSTAIWVHNQRKAGKPVFRQKRNGNKPPEPDPQYTPIKDIEDL